MFLESVKCTCSVIDYYSISFKFPDKIFIYEYLNSLTYKLYYYLINEGGQ